MSYMIVYTLADGTRCWETIPSNGVITLPVGAVSGSLVCEAASTTTSCNITFTGGPNINFPGGSTNSCDSSALTDAIRSGLDGNDAEEFLQPLEWARGVLAKAVARFVHPGIGERLATQAMEALGAWEAIVDFEFFHDRLYPYDELVTLSELLTAELNNLTIEDTAAVRPHFNRAMDALDALMGITPTSYLEKPAPTADEAYEARLREFTGGSK